MCGFQGIIFSSLIPTERGRLGSHSQKNFLPSKSRQREASFFTPVLNIPSLVPTWRGQKLCLLRNFLPQGVDHEKNRKLSLLKKYFFSLSLVPTERGQKLCLFCNFLPSRGRSRERLKIKPFEKIYFSSLNR